MPDGRRSDGAERKRRDNHDRALEAGLIREGSAFFDHAILEDGAPARERTIADAIFARARERAARASHGAKDKRQGTALSKYELLAQVLPSIRSFKPLRFEGDLDTSEHNERILILLAEFIRGRPKAAGDLLKGDTVGGQVSGIRSIVTDHLGRDIVAASGGRMLAKTVRQMRFEDGPGGERKYLAPLRTVHFQRLASGACAFDVSSPGWPTARWALLLCMHQCLLRGGEPGRIDSKTEPFRPALGICWIHIKWLDECTLKPATVLVRGRRHWLLRILVRSIKDTKGVLKRVPIPIASKHPIEEGLSDISCPYVAIRRLWDQMAPLVPLHARATTPFFLGPGMRDAVGTSEVRDAIREAARALGLVETLFGGSACRRGGATDLKQEFGAARAKAITVERGRWCPSGDIDDIYARASHEEHAGASVALATAVEGRSLEEASRGYVQPRAWRRS